MAEEESFELMPYKEIVSLKKEIETLKRKNLSGDQDEYTVTLSRISKSMDSMVQLFHQAAEELSAEETVEEKFEKKLKPIAEKLNEIIEQNKIIAEGMVAIADIVKKQNLPQQRMMPPSAMMPPPGMMPPQQAIPVPQPIKPYKPEQPKQPYSTEPNFPQANQQNDFPQFGDNQQFGSLPPPMPDNIYGAPPNLPPLSTPPIPPLPGQPQKKKGMFGK